MDHKYSYPLPPLQALYEIVYLGILEGGGLAVSFIKGLGISQIRGRQDLWCTLYVYLLVLPQQSSLLGLYGPLLLHILGNTRKYSPSSQANTEKKFFRYCPPKMDNTGRIF